VGVSMLIPPYAIRSQKQSTETTNKNTDLYANSDQSTQEIRILEISKEWPKMDQGRSGTDSGADRLICFRIRSFLQSPHLPDPTNLSTFRPLWFPGQNFISTLRTKFALRALTCAGILSQCLIVDPTSRSLGQVTSGTTLPSAELKLFVRDDIGPSRIYSDESAFWI